MFHITSYSSEIFDNVPLGTSEQLSKAINFKSVIIGENGSGKTRLLNEIISSVRDEINNDKKPKKPKYSLELGGSTINPRKIVAISASFNDKLPFSDNGKFFDEKYQYCGIRETSNASWTSSLMRKTLDNLLVCIEKNKSPKLKKIFDFLELSTTFRITFRIKKTRGIDITNCTAEELLNAIHGYSSNTSRMQVKKIENLTIEEANSIVDNFVPLINGNDKNNKHIEIKVSNSTEGVSDAFGNLDVLRRVGIIGNVSLSLSKKNSKSDYTFINASSGEAQLLFSTTAFLRYVSSNCLVIIDEPEISLHPNWQIKYFSLLELLLEKVSGCHVIIATHSHFLISELSAESSTLISLRTVDGEIKAENIASSTLGWSPESVLYRVFNVRTFNSIYLESDLQKAHSMLYSKDCDFDELELLNKKFQSLILDEADPLNKFIDTVERYLDENR
ncbi:AAA family ATPase [Vibrio splendidus]|uniref:AAA family ATPase n=1 Tax=Vibrio splendidus TaxID=29497 RepID=UPI0002EFCB03|nr:AAA family ATPase [Vibrio splendidus]OEF21992.1 hypothetical protein A145_09840 [Vibrio splendidus 5S-101]PTP81059.1 ATP-binding protein [Vibrio splendidus]